jgi:type I restriction enzyme M protein
VNHRPSKEILADLAKLEEEIQRGMKELEGMLG